MTSYKTPAAQTFTEALSNYLSGPEWQQNIQMFVKSNCDAFLGSDELITSTMRYGGHIRVYASQFLKWRYLRLEGALRVSRRRWTK